MLFESTAELTKLNDEELNYLFSNNYDEEYVGVEQQSDGGDDGDGNAKRERHCRLLGPRFRPVHLHEAGLSLSCSYFTLAVPFWSDDRALHFVWWRHLTAAAAFHSISLWMIWNKRKF